MITATITNPAMRKDASVASSPYQVCSMVGRKTAKAT